jgi:predicted metal-dependent phosphoesterase TrpH
MSSRFELEGDFHVHTNAAYRRSIYYETVPYSPSDAVRQAKDVGLDAIAITDHDTYRGLDEAFNAGAKHGVIVVGGVDLTTQLSVSRKTGIRLPHVLLLGLDPEKLKGEYLPTFLPVEEVAKWAHDRGAIVVAAHPDKEGNKISLTYNELETYKKSFDAIEAKLLALTIGKNRFGSGSRKSR